MKRFFPYLVLTFACLPVVWALFKPGFFITHDGEFNLVRLMHFYDDLQDGQFPVRWISDLNYGFGSPIPSFFYPLMYYLGSLIHTFGFDFGTSLKILIGLSTVGSVLVMYIWLSGRFSMTASLVGSLLYLFVPYRLLTMYVTGSFGVLLSFFFAPLAFMAIDRQFFPILSLAVFGLLTSHNVTAMLLLPLILIYVLIAGKDKRLLAAFVSLGLGLAAFFLLPAVLETKYVFLSHGVVVNYLDHFPSLRQLIYSPWGYFYSVAGEIGDGMSFQIGAAQLMTAFLAVVILISRRKITEKTKIVWVFLLVFITSMIMMLSMSIPIWEVVPILAQVQFPWRVLVVAVVTTPFLAAFVVDSRFGRILAVFLLSLSLWNNRNYLRTWEAIRYDDANYRSRQALFYGSTDIAWETRPVWVEEKPAWLNTKLETNSRNMTMEVLATESGEFTLDRFYYPIWRVKLDNVEVDTYPTKKAGLLAIEIPISGKHEIVIEQKRTSVQSAADAITLISFFLFIISIFDFLFWKRRKDQRPL